MEECQRKMRIQDGGMTDGENNFMAIDGYEE
jgi:hypothetical protein